MNGVGFDFESIEQVINKTRELVEELHSEVTNFNMICRFRSSEWNGDAANVYDKSITNFMVHMRNFEYYANELIDKLEGQKTNYRYIDRFD